MTELRAEFEGLLPSLAEDIEDGATLRKEQRRQAYMEAVADMADEEDDDETALPLPVGPTSLEALVESIPGPVEIEREDLAGQELYLLELPPTGGRGAASTVEIRIGVGETVFAAFGPDGVCQHLAAVDSGWAACCRYPVTSRGRIFRLKRTGEIEAALSGRLSAFGDEVDTSDLRDFLAGHLRRVVEFGLERTVGPALGYRDISLWGPEWLRPAMEGCLSLAPHLRVAGLARMRP